MARLFAVHTMEIKKKLDEPDEELLELAVVELRERFHLQSKEILVPFPISVGDTLTVTVPKMGDKKQILDLSERNARFSVWISLNKLRS